MYLMPNGKEIIVETKDGNSKLVNTRSIYKYKYFNDRWSSRVDFSHGANVYCYITGTTTIYD